jgi:hypothetical protein
MYTKEHVRPYIDEMLENMFNEKFRTDWYTPVYGSRAVEIRIEISKVLHEALNRDDSLGKALLEYITESFMAFSNKKQFLDPIQHYKSTIVFVEQEDPAWVSVYFNQHLVDGGETLEHIEQSVAEYINTYGPMHPPCGVFHVVRSFDWFEEFDTRKILPQDVVDELNAQEYNHAKDSR